MCTYTFIQEHAYHLCSPPGVCTCAHTDLGNDMHTMPHSNIISPHVTELVFQNGFRTFSLQIIGLEDDLHTAAKSGDTNRVESLIKSGVNYNALSEVCVLVFDWLMMSLQLL